MVRRRDIHGFDIAMIYSMPMEKGHGVQELGENDCSAGVALVQIDQGLQCCGLER